MPIFLNLFYSQIRYARGHRFWNRINLPIRFFWIDLLRASFLLRFNIAMRWDLFTWGSLGQFILWRWLVARLSLIKMGNIRRAFRIGRLRATIYLLLGCKFIISGSMEPYRWESRAWFAPYWLLAFYKSQNHLIWPDYL